MCLTFRMLVLLVSFLLLVIVLELVRRGKLREEYSLIFLLIIGLVIFLTLVERATAGIADRLDIKSSSLLFGVVVFLIYVVQIVQGVIISSLSRYSRDLVQKLAELDWQIRQLRAYARTLEEQQSEESSAWILTVHDKLLSPEETEGELPI